MPELGEIYIKVNARMDDLERKITGLEKTLPTKLGQAGNQAGKSFSSSLAKSIAIDKNLLGNALGGLTLAGFFKNAIDSTRDLEDALAKVKVNAGATAEEMKAVEKRAESLAEKNKSLGKTTADYTKAMLEGVWAGQKLGDAMKSSESAINLAGAAQMDVAAASQVVANAMNVFKIKAEDSARVSDVLSVAQGKASGSLQDLIKGFQQGSALAAQAGLSIEDLSAALGLMANNGVLGSDAGTSLKSMLLQLMNPTKQATEYLKNMQERTHGMGGEFYDAKGKMKPFVEVIDQLDKGLQGLTDRQKNKVLGEIFGSDGIRAALIMLKEGKQAFEDFKDGMDKSGKAAELANGNIGDTSKLMNELKVEFDKFSRDSAKDVVGAFKDVLKASGDVLHTWRDLTPEARTMITQWALYAIALKPVISGLSEVYKFSKLIKGTGLASTAGAAGSVVAADAIGAYTIYKSWTDQLKVGEEGIARGNAWERSNKESIKHTLYGKLVKFNGDFDKAAKEVFSENEKTYPNGPGPLRDTLKGWGWDYANDGSGWLKDARDYISNIQESRKSAAGKPGVGASVTPNPNDTNLNPDGTLEKPGKDGSKTAEGLTREFLKGLGAAIKTPSGAASCAYFASELLKETGVGVQKMGGAKALIDAVIGKGGVEVSRKDAKSGDLIYYYGTGYGSKEAGDFDPKTPGRQGYHVGVYAGDGYVIDSSGGKKRLDNTVHGGARFVRPVRSGKFENAGDVAEETVAKLEEAKKVIEDEARRIAISLEPIIRFKNARAAESLQKSGGTLIDVISTREFGKPFDKLTDEAHRNQVRGLEMQESWDTKNAASEKAARGFIQQWVDNIKAMNDKSRAIRENKAEVNSYLNSLERQLDKERELSSVELNAQEIKRRGLVMTKDEVDRSIALAKAKDELIRAGKEEKALDNLKRARVDAMEQGNSAARSELKEAYKRYVQEMVLVGGGGLGGALSGINNAILKGGTLGANLDMVDIDKEERLRKERDWRDFGQSLAESLVDPLKQAMVDFVKFDMKDFVGSIDNILSSAMNNIANKIINDALLGQNGIGGFLDDIVKGWFGGATSGGGTTNYSGPIGPTQSGNPLAKSQASSNLSSNRPTVVQTINIMVSGAVDNRTATQIGVEVGRQTQLALQSVT